MLSNFVSIVPCALPTGDEEAVPLVGLIDHESIVHFQQFQSRKVSFIELNKIYHGIGNMDKYLILKHKENVFFNLYYINNRYILKEFINISDGFEKKCPVHTHIKGSK